MSLHKVESLHSILEFRVGALPASFPISGTGICSAGYKTFLNALGFSRNDIYLCIVLSVEFLTDRLTIVSV